MSWLVDHQFRVLLKISLYMSMCNKFVHTHNIRAQGARGCTKLYGWWLYQIKVEFLKEQQNVEINVHIFSIQRNAWKERNVLFTSYNFCIFLALFEVIFHLFQLCLCFLNFITESTHFLFKDSYHLYIVSFKVFCCCFCWSKAVYFPATQQLRPKNNHTKLY